MDLSAVNPLLYVWILSLALAASDELLPNGGFEEGMMFWTAEGSSGGVPSRPALAAGRVGAAVMLPGSRVRTRRSCISSSSHPIHALSAVRLEGWIRTVEPSPHGSGRPAGHVSVDFLDGRGRRRGQFFAVVAMGSQDWRQFERVGEVPVGAASLRVTACADAGTTWIDELSLTPAMAPSWLVEREGQLVLHFTSEAPLDDAARQRLITRLAWVESRLGVQVGRSAIDYWFHPNVASIRAFTGFARGNFFDGDHTIHTVQALDTHEIVHAVSEVLAKRPNRFLDEGLAVALSGEWETLGIDELVRGHASVSPVPRLDELDLNFAYYKAADTPLAYAVAGSFVSYLIKTWGIERFRIAYQARGELARRMRLAYGRSLSDLEHEWIDSVLAAGSKVTTFEPDYSSPEVHEGRLVRAIDLSRRPGGCPDGEEPVEIHAGYVLRLNGIRTESWEVSWDGGTLSGTGAFVRMDQLPEGRALLRVVPTASDVAADCRVALVVRPPPHVVVRQHRIDQHGRIVQRTTTIRAHHSLEPLSQALVTLPSNGELLEARDADGTELEVKLVSGGASGLRRYLVSLATPVERGKILTLTVESDLVAGELLVQEDIGRWRFDSGARQVAAVPTYFVDAYTLPHGAHLVSSGEGVIELLGVDSVELTHSGWVPPQGSFRTSFVYSLPHAAGETPPEGTAGQGGARPTPPGAVP
jgi:hypothetical protein